MKKATYISLICCKEFVLKSGKTEKPTQCRKIIWLHSTWTIKFVLILVLTFSLSIMGLSIIFLPLKWSTTQNLIIDCPGGTLWQYGLWSFQTGGTKLERFLHKNQLTQRKLLNFENWVSGCLRSFQKSEF
jgi:hypothetical protein